jgi:hypothetical protein
MQIFDGETSSEMSIWAIKKYVIYMKMSLREMVREDWRWMKQIQDRVQSWTLVSEYSTFVFAAIQKPRKEVPWIEGMTVLKASSSTHKVVPLSSLWPISACS